jgi:hypothetical protein
VHAQVVEITAQVGGKLLVIRGIEMNRYRAFTLPFYVLDRFLKQALSNRGGLI